MPFIVCLMVEEQMSPDQLYLKWKKLLSQLSTVKYTTWSILEQLTDVGFSFVH